MNQRDTEAWTQGRTDCCGGRDLVIKGEGVSQRTYVPDPQTPQRCGEGLREGGGWEEVGKEGAMGHLR